MMRATNACEYAAAAVAQAARALGRSGPKARPNRDAEGSDCRKPIAALAAEHQTPPEPRRASDGEDVVASIPDRRAAARVRFSEMETEAFRRFLASAADLGRAFDPGTGALLRDRRGPEAGPPGLRQALLKVAGEAGKGG